MRRLAKGGCHMAKDPVTYYFCAAACKEKFLKNPQQYLGGTKG